jgi:hypothetical protein
MGVFDDLIPTAQNKGAFDDLIPNGKGRTTGEKISRVVGQGAQNFNDQVAAVVGYPGDLLSSGLKAAGAVSPQSESPIGSAVIKNGIDYLATLPGRLGDAVSQGSFSPLTDERTSRFEPENRAEKVAAGVGSAAGALASTLLPAGVAANARSAGGLTRSIAEALSSQPMVQGASALAGGAATGATDNPYVGLAASLAVPVGASAARGVVSPVTSTLNANEQSLVRLAGQEGIPLTPAQQTGSRALQGLEETMGKLPLSAGPMQGTYANQREALNRAILSRTGSTASEASPGTLDTIYRDLGQRFDDLASRTVVRPDRQFAADIMATAQNYGRRLSTDQAPVFQSYMDDLQPLLSAISTPGASPQIAGDVYRTIRSDLAKRIRTTNDLQLKDALGGIVEALDGAMERSAGSALRGEWQEARQQYAALKTVDKAMSGGTQIDRSQANIPLGAFSNAVKGADREGYARARGQYGELAKLADYLAPKIPDSGTPSRGLMTSLLTGGAIGGPIAGAGGFTPGAMMTGAAAAATPYAVSRLYNTGPARAYLSNQIAGSTDFGPLLAAEGGRQAVQAEDRRMKAIAQALLRAHEMGAR